MTVIMPMLSLKMMMINGRIELLHVKRMPFSYIERTMRNCKWILCFIFLSGSLKTVFSQQSDFQFWPQIQIGYELSDKFKLSLEEEVRLRENASQIKKELTDLGLTYKVSKFLRLSLNYRLELTYDNPDERSWRNGIYGDITLRKEIQRFRLDYRIRFQSPKVEAISEISTQNQWLKNRHKISLEYNVKGIRLTPEIEAELFLPFKRQESLAFDEYRLWAKLSYGLNKKNEIGIKYGIQQEINASDPLRAYILGISYSLDIN